MSTRSPPPSAKPKTAVVTLIVLGLVLFYSPSLKVNADRVSFVCPSNTAIVCISKGTSSSGATCSSTVRPSLTISNGYGCLIPDQEMGVKSFSTWPNGTIYLDASGGWWGGLGSPQSIMQFQMQAYGNGSFDIRINGPRAVAISSDGVFALFNQATWGQGPEIVFASATSKNAFLTVNWAPVGGACTPWCLFGSQAAGIGIPVLIVLGSILVALVFSRKRETVDRRKSLV